MQFDASRVLSDKSPRRVYKSTTQTQQNNTVISKSLHFGQRKLLLSQVEYLSWLLQCDKQRVKTQALHQRTEDIISKQLDVHKPLLVVYAGAAAGVHLPFLITLFPQVRYILIDPAPFCHQVIQISQKNESNVILQLISDICTDEMCLRLSRKYSDMYRLILISDVRTADPSLLCDAKMNRQLIINDNTLQYGWCVSLKATSAMLKFHPPYPRENCQDDINSFYTYNTVQKRNSDQSCSKQQSNNSEQLNQSVSNDQTLICRLKEDQQQDYITYLDGIRLLGVWAPKSSSQVRLIPKTNFNKDKEIALRRYSCRQHEQQCYYFNTNNRYASDCTAERLIWTQYLRQFPEKYESVQKLSSAASMALRHPLFTPLSQSFSEDQARWFYLTNSSRSAKAKFWYLQLKDSITKDVILELIRTYHQCQHVPQNVTICGVSVDYSF